MDNHQGLLSNRALALRHQERYCLLKHIMLRHDYILVQSEDILLFFPHHHIPLLEYYGVMLNNVRCAYTTSLNGTSAKYIAHMKYCGMRGFDVPDSTLFHPGYPTRSHARMETRIKLRLRNAVAKLQLGVNTGSWSFWYRVPKLEAWEPANFPCSTGIDSGDGIYSACYILTSINLLDSFVFILYEFLIKLRAPIPPEATAIETAIPKAFAPRIATADAAAAPPASAPAAITGARGADANVNVVPVAAAVPPAAAAPAAKSFIPAAVPIAVAQSTHATGPTLWIA